MELIIGGIYQGKTEYAMRRFGLSEEDLFVCPDHRGKPECIERTENIGQTECIERTEQAMSNARCVVHLERYIWDCAAAGREPLDPEAFREDAVLICEDIFCGVVPMDPAERLWRQEAGRYLKRLRARGAKVTRVVCGIGMEMDEDVAVTGDGGQPEVPAVTKRVLLIRHGSTEAGEARQYCGSMDPPLSARGAAALAGLKERYSTFAEGEVSFYTSGMRRANETMEILFGGHGSACSGSGGMRSDGSGSFFKEEPALREMDFGLFEGKSFEELRELPAYQAWITGDNEENICPGGESGAQMRARARKAFEEILQNDSASSVVIVSHGGPITAVLTGLMPACTGNRYRWQPGYGESWLLEIEVGKEGVRCQSCVPFV